jgi:hypothetical protein
VRPVIAGRDQSHNKHLLPEQGLSRYRFARPIHPHEQIPPRRFVRLLLMEPISPNAGLSRGIISEGLFATLVIMAVVTTLMASPIFDRLVGSGQVAPEPDALPSELEKAL